MNSESTSSPLLVQPVHENHQLCRADIHPTLLHTLSSASTFLVIAAAAAAAAAVQEAAKRAAADIASRKAALIATPLWQHALRCAAAIAIGLGASVLISRALHKQADKVQAGEVQLRCNVADDLLPILCSLNPPCP